jgi:hypothetical protein
VSTRPRTVEHYPRMKVRGARRREQAAFRLLPVYFGRFGVTASLAAEAMLQLSRAGAISYAAAAEILGVERVPQEVGV